MKVWLLNSKEFIAIVLSFLIVCFVFPFFASAISLGVHVVSKEGKQIFLYEDYHALVIGVSNYDQWPKLPYAREDAKEVAERLRMMGYQVNLILDPTSRELKTALNEMVYKMGTAENRAILLYYAGHGETETLADNSKMGYLIPTDCPLLKKDPIGFNSRAISMRDIESYSLKIRSKHVLMLFDSCFSGSLFGLVRAVPDDITEKSNLPVRQYITAGRQDEPVPDKSMFKRSFLIGLEGDADLTGDGYITGSELGMYLSDKVVNYTNGRQHPQYGKINNPNLDRGDYIFIPLKHREVAQKEGNDAKVESDSRRVNSGTDKEKGTSLELTFWESIKDSKNPELFKEYLRQFPDGTFAGIAKIYINEYSKLDSETTQDFVKKEAQASIGGAEKQNLEINSKLKLAILPACRRNMQFFPKGNPGNPTFWAAVGKALSNQKTFVPIYSYFDLGYVNDANRISDDIFTNDVRKNLCVKDWNKYFKEPSTDLVCGIGNQLGVDFIMMYSIVRGGEKRHNIKLFLIDVKTKKIYSRKGSITGPENMWSDVKKFTEETLHQFEKETSRP